MRDSEIILSIHKGGIIKLPWGFMVLNGLEEGDVVQITIRKIEEEVPE